MFGLQSEDTALLWIVSRDYSPVYMEKAYLKNLRAKAEDPLQFAYPDVAESVLLVSNLQSGPYTVELWDTITGSITQTITVESADGIVSIPLPVFNTDIAIKVKAS